MVRIISRLKIFYRVTVREHIAGVPDSDFTAKIPDNISLEIYVSIDFSVDIPNNHSVRPKTSPVTPQTNAPIEL